MSYFSCITKLCLRGLCRRHKLKRETYTGATTILVDIITRQTVNYAYSISFVGTESASSGLVTDWRKWSILLFQMNGNHFWTIETDTPCKEIIQLKTGNSSNKSVFVVYSVLDRIQTIKEKTNIVNLKDYWLVFPLIVY